MIKYINKTDSKSTFLHRLKNNSPQFFNVSVKDEDMFFVLLKSTHGGGYYFVGNIAESENGLCITGSIVHDPDENGNPKEQSYSKKEKIKDFLEAAIGLILFWWIIVIVAIFALFGGMFKKDKDVPLEKKLDDFMIDFMGCEKFD